MIFTGYPTIVATLISIQKHFCRILLCWHIQAKIIYIKTLLYYLNTREPSDFNFTNKSLALEKDSVKLLLSIGRADKQVHWQFWKCKMQLKLLKFKNVFKILCFTLSIKWYVFSKVMVRRTAFQSKNRFLISVEIILIFLSLLFQHNCSRDRSHLIKSIVSFRCTILI